jgi:hypothetical protein
VITAREMLPSDRGFVVSTWVKSSGKRNHWRVVDRILDGGARVVVLATGGALHGWACTEGPVLHYAYVPPELRRIGLARRAIAEALGSYPDVVPVSHKWPRKSTRFRFDPYLILGAAPASSTERKAS